MVATTAPSNGLAQPARVYAVSATGSSSTATASANSSSLPDILRRRGSSNIRKKRRSALKVDEQLARIELIQDFEFPEASNCITSTRDGQHIVATGTYKPQMRVWECDQLSLKFERHTDAENVDFKLLSDDWTKSIHLQSDRSVQIHAQGGHHARVRIPKFGRALGYHFPTAEGLVGALGNEVYRINLDQGRFMAPFTLGEDEEHGNVTGCDAVDVNPAHGLLSFGTEGAGTVELWDPRARRRAGKLSVKVPAVLDAALFAARRALPGVLDLDGDDEAALTQALRGLSVCALSSKEDGLNLAAGTNTGHTLLYDLRMDKPYAIKDQGFGLPIKSLSWIGDRASVASRAGGAGTSTTAAEVADSVLSADSKVIKVWNRNDANSNIVSITPNTGVGDLNHVHHVPGSGLVLAAVEGTRCAAWYVPVLGPAPKWCSFLDNLTDELDEEQATGGKRGIYEDFKFVDKPELERLELSHLVGTNLLRPYMHGYFISLSLWERARLLANPTAYADARERAILAKMEKEAETRIRTTPKDMQRRREAEKLLQGVRVNRELAEKIRKAEEREERRRERMENAAKARAEAGGEAKEAEDKEEEDIDSEAEEAAKEKKAAAKATNLLRDDRFKELFTNPDFQVDEGSREFALLNPSTAARASSSSYGAAGAGPSGLGGAEGKRKRTAVEEEEDASEAESLDPDVEDRRMRDGDGSGDESDSSAEGDLGQFDARHHVNVRRKELEAAARLSRGRGARLVDDDDDDAGAGFDDDEGYDRAARGGGKKRTFGERLQKGGARGRRSDAVDVDGEEEGAMGGRSISWTPTSSSSKGKKKGSSGATSEDTRGAAKEGKAGRGKKGETFGAGLSKGASSQEGVGVEGLSEDQRFGRERRRDVGRSGSRNAILRR